MPWNRSKEEGIEKNMKISSKEFEKHLKLLFYAANTAKQHYEIWWILNDHEKKHMKVWGRYSHFFGPSSFAHFTTMLMHICKIYDSGKNIDYLIGNISMQREILREVEGCLAQKKELISRVNTLRNEYFAHNVIDGEDAFKKASLKPENISTLIDFSIDLLKKVSNGIGYTFEDSHIKTTEDLLKNLMRQQSLNQKKVTLKRDRQAKRISIY